MDEIKKLTADEFEDMVSRHSFERKLLAKDYYITVLLYLLKGIKGIYFKGGTALNKIFLDHARLSEDIDFTLERNLKEVKPEIVSVIENSKIFNKTTEDKNVEGFLRIVVHYKGFSGEDGEIFIDLNERGKLLGKPEEHKIDHFYPDNIPPFLVKTLSKEEMIAEKVAATIGRNKPRDHFDVYKIIKLSLPINLELVKRKCKDSGDEFSIIKMFNQSQKLHKRWNEDMIPLLAEEISFKEVMTFLAKHFKLKEEKDNLKTKK
jgi:predicted nucleotidyltransferase component of viral defense system